MRRIYAYDMIRIYACLAVVMIHVSAIYVKMDESSTYFLVGNIFNSISRCGVPLFLMLSGSLMLNENKTKTIKQMVQISLEMGVILLFWSTIYAIVYKLVLTKMKVTLVSLMKTILFAHYHMWYLYVIIGLYLITPILRLFVKKENKSTITYLLGLSILFTFVLPLINHEFQKVVESISLVRLGKKIHFEMIGTYLTYYILGYYLTNFDLKANIKKLIYLLGSSSLIYTIVMTQINKNYDFYYDNSLITILLTSVMIFIFIYELFKNKTFTPKVEKIIIILSQLTFSVYLIHVLVLYYVDEWITISNPWIELIVIYILTVSLSFVISSFLSKIKYVKKTIKC